MNAKTIAKQITTRREALGMTQATAAQAAGMPAPNWNTLERPDQGPGRNPTMRTLSRVAKVLQCTMADLIA